MKKKALAALLALLVAVCVINSTAFADWYDDVKPGSTWVKIEGENFVADTFYGVEALYNENNTSHQCYQLVERFYREAYGLDIYAAGGFPGGDDSKSGAIMLTSGYEMVKTETASVGDVIFVSANMRGSEVPHWAIVKEIGGGYITMFEQNVVWEGKAAVNRKIKYPSDSYYIYTPVNTSGGPAPVLRYASDGNEPETEVHTEAPTIFPEEITTEIQTINSTTAKAVTTTQAVTTAKPTATQKTTTTKKVTTTAKPATTKPTTTVPAATTAVSTTVTVEPTSEWYYTYTYTSAQTETEIYTSSEYTYEMQEEKSSDNLHVILIFGVTVLSMSALIMIIIARRRK